MTETLIQHEDLVYDLIQEYLDKNRSFNAPNIINFLNSRFSKSSINLSVTGIKLIIQSLIKKKLIVEGSKISKKRVLLNPNRRTIYDFIKKNPGSYFNKIVTNLNFSISVVGWHLKTLLRFNCIKRETIDNREVYFHISLKPESAKLIYLISIDKCKKIIDYFKQNQEIDKKSQLYTDLKMHHNTVNKYLELLEEFRIITKRRIGKRYKYIFNKKAYEKISIN